MQGGNTHNLDNLRFLICLCEYLIHLRIHADMVMPFDVFRRLEDGLQELPKPQASPELTKTQTESSTLVSSPTVGASDSIPGESTDFR